MAAPAPIQQLAEHVVHRIAAGEVIQRPASALKELIENSLDAGASKIVVTLKEGGLKFLQIQDDGSGIRQEDLPILCHRHTTSKLRNFEDLETISTLGFRGEALASISFVAHMAVVTMTSTMQHGWRVEYRDSEVVPPGAKPVAAVQGTCITVEDMFYNVPARRKAFKAGQEEYNLVKDLMQRYAVYCAPGVSFTLKRQGEARSDLHTLSSASRLNVIRTLFGGEVASKLLPLEVEQGGSVGPEVGLDAGMRFKVQGYISNLTYIGRRTALILFINGRPVEQGQLKRALETLYAAHNPKANKPWAFLDLLLPPRHVEVNVHPTKKEVGFLHQDAVIDAICQAVETALLAASSSRSFAVARLPLSSQLPDNGRTQVVGSQHAGPKGDSTAASEPQQLQEHTGGAAADMAPTIYGGPGAASQPEGQQQQPSQLQRRSSSGSGARSVQLQLGGTRPSATAPAPSARPERLVRMDPRMQTLDGFLVARPAPAGVVPAPARKRKASAAELEGAGGGLVSFEEQQEDLDGFNSSNLQLSTQAAAAAGGDGPDDAAGLQNGSLPGSRVTTGGGTQGGRKAVTQQGRLRLDPVVTQLTSVAELLEEVEQQKHDGLAAMFRDHVWVGLADPTLLLLQHQTKLYLVDLTQATRDMCYQLLLRRWENHQQLRLDPPLPVRELLLAALGAEATAGRWQVPPGTNPEQLVVEVQQLLADKAPMLQEYLGLVFDAAGQQLQALPLLLEGFTPDLAQLPQLLLALVRDVDWSEEQSCFKGLCTALADFYALQQLLPSGSPVQEQQGRPEQPPPPQQQQQQQEEQRHEQQPGMLDTTTGQHPLRTEQHCQQQNTQQQQQQQQPRQSGQEPYRDVQQQQQQIEMDIAALEQDDLALQEHAGEPLLEEPLLTTAAAGGGLEADRQQEASGCGAAATDPLAAHRTAEEREWLVRHVVCRGLRWLLKPPQHRARDGSVLLLTSMERLYKVFERCR